MTVFSPRGWINGMVFECLRSLSPNIYPCTAAKSRARRATESNMATLRDLRCSTSAKSFPRKVHDADDDVDVDYVVAGTALLFISDTALDDATLLDTP
jgi:hypothetical protein